MLVTPATSGFSESQTGGFSDALIGTLIVAVMGFGIALPIGVGVAVWLVEYGRPAALARITESTIEAIAGIPSIVFALFGTVIFSSTALGFLSRTNEGVVFGRSFFAASSMLSLVALPLVVAITREGLRRDSPARAGGLLRGRQDEGGDDAADPAAGQPSPDRHRGDARASAGSSATRRSSSSCSARPRTSPRSGAPSRSTTCAARERR